MIGSYRVSSLDGLKTCDSALMKSINYPTLKQSKTLKTRSGVLRFTFHLVVFFNH